MAQRGQLLHLALCRRRQCFPLGVEAVSHWRRDPQTDRRDRRASYAATQHGSLASALTADTVRRAVLALPQRYREPLVLFYFYEMDVTAAARTMGLAEGTLKARLARGRALLRRRFPHLENELAGQPSEQSQRIAAPGSKFIKVAQSPGKEA